MQGLDVIVGDDAILLACPVFACMCAELTMSRQVLFCEVRQFLDAYRADNRWSTKEKMI